MKFDITSFLIYTFFIGLSLLFYYLSIKEKKNKKTYYFLILISILFLAFLPSFRDISVGVDVGVYGKRYWDISCNCSSFNSLRNKLPDAEIGYLFLNYICSRVSTNISFLFFVTILLIIVPVYYVSATTESPFLSVLVFDCTLYLASFNVIKQSLSSAWFVLAYVLFTRKKKIPAAVCLLFSICFHSSALLSLLILVVIFLSKNIKSNVRRYITIFLSIAATFIFLNKIGDVLLLFKSVQIIPNKYYEYEDIMLGNASSYYYTNGFKYILELLFLIAFFLLCFYYCKKRGISKDNTVYILIISVASFVCIFCKVLFNTNYGYRLVMQLEYMWIIILPYYLGNGFRSIRRLKIKHILLITTCISYYFILYMLYGSHGILPYCFAGG